MRRLIIAIDCDDVLVATTPFFIDAYNREYGTAITLADANNESPELWQADTEEIARRLAALTETEAYRMLGPVPEEVAVLRELSKHHELRLVTARKEQEREMTQAMLDRDLAGVFTSMEFVGWTGSKGEVCKRLGADVLVDDNVRHLKNAIELGLPTQGALLFGDYEWNAVDHAVEGLTRCGSWQDVHRAIDVIAE